MQKVLCSAAIAAVLASVSIAAHASGDAFISVSAGRSQNNIHNPYQSDFDPGDYGIDYHASTDKTDVAFGVTGGYRWTVEEVFAIGPEVGYVDLGSVDRRYSASVPRTFDERGHGEVKNKAVLLGVNAKWKLGHNWSLTARTGAVHAWTRIRTSLHGVDYFFSPSTTYSDSTSHSSNDTGIYGALNVGYDFTPHFGVNVGYEHYDFDYTIRGVVDGPRIKSTQKIGVWAASAEFRF
jgi:opacity protein-like surface antigen